MDDWPTYGRAVRERREALGIRQGAGGVSTATWRKVEAGRGAPYRRTTLVAIARALGWPDDAFDRMRAGRPPDELLAGGAADDRALEARLAVLEAELVKLREALAARVSGPGR
jgi:transcriptional regulator with XRE-family HTH domain